MILLEQVNSDDWPKGNYFPMLFIDLKPAFFKNKLGLDFFVECDDLGEYETSLLKFNDSGHNIYFSLFRYCGVEQGVNVLLDREVKEPKKMLSKILKILDVGDTAVRWSES